jgi:hypothetical protein
MLACEELPRPPCSDPLSNPHLTQRVREQTANVDLLTPVATIVVVPGTSAR